MAGIPLNLALVQNAVPFPLGSQVQALPVTVCKRPLEGPKAIPIQITFTNAAAQFVDLSAGLPPMSQVSMMYIDATGSADEVIIIFPDTGYQVPVQGGNSLLCPVFTSSQGGALPKFYVVINTNGVISPTDVVNIILFNFFIPEFAGTG